MPVSARPEHSRRTASVEKQAILRLAFAVTSALVIGEWFGWHPTFLAPILTATLVASLPGPLPIKAGILLILVQAGGAYAAFALSSLLRDAPLVLFGSIGVIIFICFSLIASGRAFLPLLLVLICFSTIPVVTMVSPEQGGALPLAFVRGMVLTVAIMSLAYALWPRTALKASAAPAPSLAAPLAVAVAGTAIVLPLMLIFLMYGLTDALPVLITTVVIVLNFDPKRGLSQSLAMMVGNFIGGTIAVSCYAVLQIAPSLTSLTLITLVMTMLFARGIHRGGARAAVALVTLNQTIVMLSLSLMPASSPGIWLSRLLEFAIACTFAISMMMLLLPRADAQRR